MDTVRGNGEMENSIQGLFIQLMHKYYGKCFQQIGDLKIHPRQLPILKAIHCHKGVSQRELANILHIKPPTVTVAVQRLEKSALVYRKQDGEDQRISRIYLTDQGEDIAREIMEIIKINEDALIRGFSESEICLIRRFFIQMIENIENIKTEGVNKEK